MAGKVSIATQARAQNDSRIVQGVAESAGFKKAPALRRLLLYLWEHRDEDISEYAIGLDVLGKRDLFDPKIDASVRVHISRLRQKLREYFENEGNHHPYRLVVPQGGHRLLVEAAAREAATSVWLRNAKAWWVPALACVLAALCFGFWTQAEQARKELTRLQGNLELPAVWKAILKPGRLTRVIYPIPVFYHWDTLRMRDVRINHPEGWKTSATLKPYIDALGPPTISQSYTVSTDTMAAIHLTRFLSSHGTPLEVSPTGSLSLDQFGSDNLIFLGIPPTNARLQEYLEKLSFQLQDGSGMVINSRRIGSEPAVFRPRRDPGATGRQENYGVVAVLPGHAAGTSLMLMMGMQTSAIATLLTSPQGLRDFTRWWKASGEPEHFEVVVRTIADGVRTQVAEVTAFRAIR